MNLPNWLSLTFRVEEGEWFSIDEVDILSYRQTLDLRHGLCGAKCAFATGRAARRRSVRRGW